MLEPIIQATIVILIGTGIAGIFGYIRKKFNCQEAIKKQLNIVSSKVDAIVDIQRMILEKTHPDLVDTFDKLVRLATKK